MPPETPQPMNDGIPALEWDITTTEMARWDDLLAWWDAHPMGEVVRENRYDEYLQRDWYPDQQWYIGDRTLFGMLPCDD